MNRRVFALSAASWLALSPSLAAAQTFEVTRSDAEWRARLAPEAYRVLRQQGTERPGSSQLDKEKQIGRASCRERV